MKEKVSLSKRMRNAGVGDIYSYVHKLEAVLETGKLWIESRDASTHNSLWNNPLQKTSALVDLRLDFENAIADTLIGDGNDVVDD